VLTLKLMNRTTDNVRIVECGTVDIIRNGEDTKIKVSIRDEVLEFLVSDDLNADYHIAYVENARGSTTEIIRPKGK